MTREKVEDAAATTAAEDATRCSEDNPRRTFVLHFSVLGSMTADGPATTEAECADACTNESFSVWVYDYSGALGCVFGNASDLAPMIPTHCVGRSLFADNDADLTVSLWAVGWGRVC